MMYPDTLQTMIGGVRLHKPNATPDQVVNWLNWRIRQLIDFRTYWSGLIGRGVVDVPAAITEGALSTTTGSTVVPGFGANWPSMDLVHTTLTSGIGRPGIQAVVPADMTNITDTSVLYVGGDLPEIVTVREISPGGGAFTAVFAKQHAAGDPITASSLVGRQLKVGYMYPIYTILAVADTTSTFNGPVFNQESWNGGDSALIIDMPWAGPAVEGSAYTLLKMYYTFATDIKDMLSVVDPQQGLELLAHYPLEQLNFIDPQRSATNLPQYVVDHSPDVSGNAVYELWPAPTVAMKLYFEYYRQWPDMKDAGDIPPPFMNPAVIIAGAIADALRTKVAANDPFYDPHAAGVWEGRFMTGADALSQADNGKYQKAYTWDRAGGGTPGGANFWRQHDPDVWAGNW